MYFLGIDTSTTSSKALLIDDKGVVIAVASSPHTLQTPKPLWSEQDPHERIQDPSRRIRPPWGRGIGNRNLVVLIRKCLVSIHPVDEEVMESATPANGNCGNSD